MAAGGQAVDRLLIQAGHNLDGMTLDILYSDDDIGYYAAVAQWVQSGTGLINKSWAALAKRYWKFAVTSPAVVPEMAELFITQTYEWERNPARPAGPMEAAFNVERRESASGRVRFLVNGQERQRRSYRVPRCGQAQKDNVLSLNGAWAGSKPFWLEDHEGLWLYGELLGPVSVKEVAHQAWSFEFDFQEVLG